MSCQSSARAGQSSSTFKKGRYGLGAEMTDKQIELLRALMREMDAGMGAAAPRPALRFISGEGCAVDRLPMAGAAEGPAAQKHGGTS